MKLYYSPGACSLAPHIALSETGAKFDLVKVNLKTKQTDDGKDFNSVTPKGYVPALELDNGEVLTEAPALLQYIADLYPDAALAPRPGTLERARLQEWLNFIATELHKSFGQLFHPLSEETKLAALAQLQRRFPYVAAQLADRSYLLGEKFSVADIYLFTVMRWCPAVKFDLAPWPVLTAYQTRIAARAPVQAAMRAEGLIG